jgi:dephospho-CoA kinase
VYTKAVEFASAEFERVLWLGGSPCTGKSTVAKRLAERFGLSLYHADDSFERHCQKATERYPTLHTINRLAPDEVWLIPVERQFMREVQLYREEFDFVQGDLRTIKQPVIAEGAALLPECVAPFMTKSTRAVYLIPTEAFQRRHYAKRDWARGVVAKTSDPEQAFENWMQRDAKFALEVKRQALSLDLPVITVDGTESLEEIETRVPEYLTLSE